MRLAFFLLLTIPIVAFAQQKPKVDKDYYVGDDGKLFWHGKSPVYIFLADNPEGKNLHLLKSQVHDKYTNPLFLDTEGVNYIRTNWAADSALNQVKPLTEVLFEVYRDNESPDTKVTFENAPKYRDKNYAQYYGQGLILKTKASDVQSGVQQTYLSVDNSDFKPFGGNLNVSKDKKFNVKVYSVDNTGNEEAIKAYDFRVDLVAPVSEYTVHSDRSGMIFSPRTFIKLQSEDTVSGLNRIAYKIDDGKEVVFKNQINLASLDDGPHKINFYGYDNVKNREKGKVISFYLDKISPVVKATIVGDQYQNRGRVFVSTRTKIKLTATDNKAGVTNIKYSVDDSDPVIYREPFALKKSKGNHVVTYYATDKVNNSFEGKLEESNMSRSSLDIDMEVPVINHAFSGKKYFSRDTTFITSASLIELLADDLESGVKEVGYKINDSKGQAYTDPIKLEKEGFYLIDFYAKDQVNNRNTKSFFFILDNTGPQVIDVLSMRSLGLQTLEDQENHKVDIYTKGVQIFLAATDNVVDVENVYYKINDGEFQEYNKPVKIKTKGLVTYQIKAVDKLGNETITEKKELFIK